MECKMQSMTFPYIQHKMQSITFTYMQYKMQSMTFPFVQHNMQYAAYNASVASCPTTTLLP